MPSACQAASIRCITVDGVLYFSYLLLCTRGDLLKWDENFYYRTVGGKTLLSETSAAGHPEFR
jgi:hypothetical protein